MKRVIYKTFHERKNIYLRKIVPFLEKIVVYIKTTLTKKHKFMKVPTNLFSTCKGMQNFS